MGRISAAPVHRYRWRQQPSTNSRDWAATTPSPATATPAISYINATDGVTVDLLAGTRTARAGDLANVGTDTFTGVNAVQGS